VHILNVSDLSKAYEGRTLFEGVSFGIDAGDRVAVVGRNGAGKSTLLQLVAGIGQPDAGRVVANNRAHIAHLPQNPTYPAGLAVRQVAAPDDATVRDHEVDEMLDRLGLDPTAEVAALSGGQRRRAALAAALLPKADLVILDEPTNHLDVGTIDWLEDVLRERNSALLLVTHDRYFLERLTTRIVEIDQGRVFTHEGTYSDLLQARAEREELRTRKERRRQNLLRKEVAWLRRGPKARTSKPKFRLEQAERLQRGAPEPDEAQLELGTGRRRLGSDVLEIEDVRVTYGGDQPVLDKVSIGFGPGDRAAVVGPNGSGKTTLLRVLTGELTPEAGTVHTGKTVEIGYYRQEHRDPPLDQKVIDTVTDIAPWIPLANGEKLPASTLAERFGFDDRLQHAAVARLSGGERRRLALLHVLVAAPNVLVLDEPTNDLDLDTLRVLEDHLDGFGGTLIIASHDRYLLDRTCDVIYGLEPDGSISSYLDFDQYHEERLRKERAIEAAAVRHDRVKPDASTERNRGRQARMREVRSLEARMQRLQSERADLHHALATHATDPERLVSLQADLDTIEQELTTAEERWLDLAVD